MGLCGDQAGFQLLLEGQVDLQHLEFVLFQ